MVFIMCCDRKTKTVGLNLMYGQSANVVWLITFDPICKIIHSISHIY